MRHAGARPEAGDVEAGLVRIRPLKAIAGEAAIDEFRIDRFQTLIVEPGARESARADIGQEDIRAFG